MIFNVLHILLDQAQFLRLHWLGGEKNISILLLPLLKTLFPVSTTAICHIFLTRGFKTMLFLEIRDFLLLLSCRET